MLLLNDENSCRAYCKSIDFRVIMCICANSWEVRQMKNVDYLYV